ncbi:MAG TPA: hypothetical protein VL947_00170 [Cytophagales bacterium]|nr:hypothetical protein [Cytophagales bacterium]
MIQVAKYINSIQFVVICILCFQTMLVIDTATLLYTSFPDYMNTWAKAVAACVGSITIEAFLLMVSVNMYLMSGIYGKRFIPIMFGVISMVMTLFFMDTFTYSDPVVTLKRVFISFIFGAINYLLSEIFVKKWQEHLNDNDLQDKLIDFTNTIDAQNDIIQGLTEERDDLENLCIDYKVQINTQKIGLEVMENTILRHQQEKEELQNKLTRKRNQTINR